ncbi:biliverdin-producing heme oxygenase [Brevifollis gellanilyticus]|uniref:biliverdin-producing heme oxygenase n=1 Tax=Brevifollis gellanilyticus TaxID=748831 RepID=UPI001478E167|nr:biliverdin-producing heme oxygenase [Brevifollis gellanilyticus]
MTSTTSETLARLRAATATVHRQLEDQVNIPQVCGKRETYEQLLEDFLGFWEPLESCLQQISGWEERGFDWGERAKAGMLLADLRALGRTAAEIEALPRCTNLPRPESLEEAFGCAYVVEGSTLGGRHILGVLAKTDIPEDARHYFASYGDQVGARWREFCAMLSEFADTEAEMMVPQAVETFNTLSAWLARPR